MFQTDRNGNLTDDSDRWLSGHESTFDADPAPDWEGMEYDDWHRGPKCGGCRLDGDGYLIPGARGCRHCNPVDPECKPYKFGIELWECEAALSLRREVCGHARLGLCRDIDLPTACRWVGFSVRRAKHSDRVWDRLCDECQTHAEAKEKYEAWARRAVTVRYRDEPRPPGPVAKASRAKRAA
jgi:hypothetical protein